MKLPKITRLPSGNWNCRIRVNGKVANITEPTKELCEAQAIAAKIQLLEEKKGREIAEKTEACKNALFKHKNNGLTYINGRYIETSRVIDREISLKKLYKRDEGICHICGEKCDFEDYWYMMGKKGQDIFVAGDKYPVVDHVIPIKHGGLQSWENVKLAHKICNTKKGDELPLPTTADLYREYKKTQGINNITPEKLLDIIHNNGDRKEIWNTLISLRDFGCKLDNINGCYYLCLNEDKLPLPWMRTAEAISFLMSDYV